jgi:hypothetical protein
MALGDMECSKITIIIIIIVRSPGSLHIILDKASYLLLKGGLH